MNHNEELTKNLETVAALIARQLPRGIFLSVGGPTPNTMTVGWGGYSFYWGRPLFVAPIRPQRFTHTILRARGEFTLSVPDGTMAEQLRLAGTLSGRTGNKFEAIGLSTRPAQQVDAPIIDGCDWHLECKVLSTTALTLAGTDRSVVSAHYPGHDFHTLFFAEILACYPAE